MEILASFWMLCKPFQDVMTRPTCDSLKMIVLGWLFASRRTITGMIVAAGAVGQKHHSAFHRVFATARWSLDQMGLALFGTLEPWLGETVFVALDDTLARKRGLKVFGAGMHHDPLLSSRNKSVTNWGHNWIVLGVLVQFPLWPKRVFCLPILFRLYLNTQASARHRRVHRTRPELAVELLKLLGNHRKRKRFHVVADSTYGGQSVLGQLPANCDLTSRLLMNARLYELAPPRTPHQRGRSRKRGAKLPSPREMLGGRAQRLELDLYGRQEKARISTATGCVHDVPQRRLRIVAVEPLTGGRKPQAFYSTCHTADALQVLTWSARRWAMEVTFHEAKGELGFQEPPGWSRRAVERTAPVALLLYALVVVWFVQTGHRHHRQSFCPWYPHKQHASFADMLQTLKQQTLEEHIFATVPQGRGDKKLNQLLQRLAQLAS